MCFCHVLFVFKVSLSKIVNDGPVWEDIVAPFLWHSLYITFIHRALVIVLIENTSLSSRLGAEDETPSANDKVAKDLLLIHPQLRSPMWSKLS